MYSRSITIVFLVKFKGEGTSYPETNLFVSKDRVNVVRVRRGAHGYSGCESRVTILFGRFCLLFYSVCSGEVKLNSRNLF